MQIRNRPATVVVVALALDACCFFSNVPASPVDQQRAVARVLEPESLAPSSLLPASARVDRGVIRMRAYVDDAFNAATRDPDARLREIVSDASAILDGQLGARIELVDVRPFPPQLAQMEQKELPPLLQALKSVDPADDVDVVVAFVGAAPIVTNALHQLGYADVLGRYAVVRALDDARELRAIADALNRLPDDEVSKLFTRRRRHKAAIVLLHEIAHDLGGVHVTDPEAVLFPGYSIDQNRLSEDSLALLERGVVWLHAKNDDERRAAQAELQQQLERRRERLEPRDVDDTMAMLKSRNDALALKDAQNEGGQGQGPALILSPEDAPVFNAAIAAANKGDNAAAFANIKTIADKPDAPSRVLTLTCWVATMDGVVALDGKARCDRAMKKDGDDLAAAVGALRFASKANDVDAEAALFADAARRLPRVLPSRDAVQLAARRDLARIAAMKGRLSLAEDALAGFDDDNGVGEMRARLAVMRRQAGLQRGTVAVDVEGALFGEVLAIEKQAESDAAGAKARVDDDLVKYGDVAGLLAAKCDVLWAQRKAKDAAAACSAAIAKDDEASVAHALLGIVLASKGKMREGAKELARALELDPETRATWSALWQVLRHSGNAKDAADVAARYQAKFGVEIQ